MLENICLTLQCHCRVPDIQASYLEDGQFSLPLMESMNAQKGKFALSFKDDV